MFNSHLYSIKTALVIFPVIASVVLVPYLIYHYRKYGSLSLFRTFVIYSFIFYLITAYFLVMLPLKPRFVVAAMKGPVLDLRFLGFVKDLSSLGLLDIQSKSDILLLITNDRFIEPLFNIFLLIPLGVYLRYYFKRSWYEVIVLGFLCSLVFELSQLSGLFGFYSRPHRLFQVDDLILNTLGSLVGYIMTPLFVFMFPSRDDLDRKAQSRQHKVSYIRKGLAFALDWLIIVGIGLVTTKLVYGSIHFNLMRDRPLRYFRIIFMDQTIYLTTALLVILNFIIIPYVSRGYTIGKYLVRIKLQNIADYELSFGGLFLRTTLFYLYLNIYYWTLFYLVNLKMTNVDTSAFARTVPLMLLVLTGFVLFDIVHSWYQGVPLAYERLSGVKNVSLHENLDL